MGLRTTVVSVSCHSRETIGSALEPLEEACERGDLRVVVVDNASTDDSAEYVRREHGWVDLVECGVNLGYGKGCNLGFRYVRTPYVMFLNPDAVLTPEAIFTLERFMDEHPRAGIVGPALVDLEGGLQHTYGLPTPGTVCRRALRPGDIRKRPIVPGGEPFLTDWLSGAVQLIRSDVMRELGGFDPRFFLYFEETDLCRRVARAGRELWAVGTACGTHIVGASHAATGQSVQHGANLRFFYPSRFYYLAKHHGRLAAAGAELFEVGVTTVRAIVKTALGRDASTLWTRLRAPILRIPTAPDYSVSAL